MSRDNKAPASEPRKPQARRLTRKALAASSVGDTRDSDRLFAEAERRDPQAVAEVLQEDQADSHPPAAGADSHLPEAARRDSPPGQAESTPHRQPAGPVRTPPVIGSGAAPAGSPRHPTRTEISLRVNGQTHQLAVDARATLLDALRDHLGLTGTKKGCALGQCGACTVLLDGRRIDACLTLAVMAQGHAITTIEGIAENGVLHPMQAAFVAHDAFQCGYCTPGQIMAAIGLLNEGRGKDDAEIRENMSGNICRCGAYLNIVDAVRAVRDGQGG
jgi:xanthine dehydrogenase YagT iron-sulfur-binding subunit